MNILTGIYLGINAWSDWKKREIDLRVTALFTATAFILHLFLGWELYGTGILPGLGLLAISLWTRMELGSGDGVVTMAAGWMMGFLAVWRALTGAFLLAGLTGAFLALIRKKNRREQMPFIPFLMAGFLMERWVDWLS